MPYHGCRRRACPGPGQLASSARPCRRRAPAFARKPATAARPPQASSATHGPALVSFCASILMNAEIAVGEVLDHDFPGASLLGHLQHLRSLQLSDLFQQAMLRLLRRFALFLRFADLLRYFPNVRGEEHSSFGQRLEVMPGRGHRAQSADELDAHTLLYFLGFAQQDGADLSGAADVRATAGVQVEVTEYRSAAASRARPAESCARPSCALRLAWRNESRPDGLPQ